MLTSCIVVYFRTSSESKFEDIRQWKEHIFVQNISNGVMKHCGEVCCLIYVV